MQVHNTSSQTIWGKGGLTLNWRKEKKDNKRLNYIPSTTRPSPLLPSKASKVNIKSRPEAARSIHSIPCQKKAQRVLVNASHQRCKSKCVSSHEKKSVMSKPRYHPERYQPPIPICASVYNLILNFFDPVVFVFNSFSQDETSPVAGRTCQCDDDL
jgi:hypothetical protein